MVKKLIYVLLIIVFFFLYIVIFNMAIRYTIGGLGTMVMFVSVIVFVVSLVLAIITTDKTIEILKG